jgi:all-trans-retinol 13,14-reductase
LMYNLKAGEELTTPCPSYVSLYVGLDVNDTDINIPAQNVWHLVSHDHDGEWLKMMEAASYEEIGENAPFLFISNESAKDPDYAQRHPNKSTLEVFAPAPAKWFARWQDSATHKHGSDYEKLKERIGQDLLKALIFHFPQIKGHIAFAEVGTPLTVDHYLGRSGEGETYNLDHTISRFDSLHVQQALHPKTTVKGLFLCGQDALCVSVVGSTMSGLMVSCVVSLRGFLCAFPYFFPLLEMFFW